MEPRAPHSPQKALLAALAERRIVLTMRCGNGRVRRCGAPSPVLEISVQELAAWAAERAKRKAKSYIFHRIAREARTTGNRRVVMRRCEEYAGALRGRRGCSALRLYNDYFARQRRLAHGGTKAPVSL